MNAPALSLMVGSDALGWTDFGGKAVLETMTKAMPGGDGSLEFTLPGDAAWKNRNVIVPEAEVRLHVNGEPVYGGLLSCDPLRHRLGAHESIALAATGPWGLASRDSRYAYLALDTEYERWQQYRGVNDHSGRFTVDKEGHLELQAHKDRTYDGNDACRLYYLFMDGLFLDQDGFYERELTGIDFEYKFYLPTARWKCGIVAGNTPVDADSADMFVWGPFDGTAAPHDHSDAWYTATVDVASMFTMGSQCLMLELFTDGGTGSPDPRAFVRIRWGANGGVRGQWELEGFPNYADRAVSIATILTDCAEKMGATVMRITGLTTVPGEFVARYPTTVAAVVEQATLRENAPVEAYFDLDQNGARRFTANSRPASVDLTRNRLWSVGGRAGESLKDLVPDWEATSQMVQVLYAMKDDATLPDGMLAAAHHPAATTSTYPLVETVDLSGEPPMTAAAAAVYAETIYRSRQDSRYSGDVALAAMARTAQGQEVPTVLLSPGDRLGTPSLLDVDANGLYVRATSYNFRSDTCTPTVGEPWDPLELRPQSPAKNANKRPKHGHKGSYTRRSGAG